MRNATLDEQAVAEIDHSRLTRALRGPATPDRDYGLIDDAVDIIRNALSTIDLLQSHLEQMLAIAEKATHMLDPMKRADLSDAFAEACAALDQEIEKGTRKEFSLIDAGLGILAFDLGIHKSVHVSVPHINLTSDWKGLCLMSHITTIRRKGQLDDVFTGLDEAFSKLDHARTTYLGSIAWLERHR